MLKQKLVKTSDCCYKLALDKDIAVFGTQKIIDDIDEAVFEQTLNMFSVPGLTAARIMPDAHSGYGPPIGFVGAFNSKEGAITPYGVGSDISCGMRLISSSLNGLTENDIQNLVNKISKSIPLGTNKYKSGAVFDKNDLKDILKYGAEILNPASPFFKNKFKKLSSFTLENDFSHTEKTRSETDLEKFYYCLSDKAVNYAFSSAGTLGGGNHFIEIQKAEDIYDEALSEKFGIKKDGIFFMIHSGSRYLGKFVCDFYTKKFYDANNARGVTPVNKNLGWAKVNTPLFSEYFSAMNACSNYAVLNRHAMMIILRKILCGYFNETAQNLKLNLIYDLSHNIARFEEFKGNNFLVLRKGATRAFCAKHPELSGTPFYKTGHPVIIPGAMGKSSYVLVGTDEGEKSFYSANHGAGRVMGRNQAIKTLNENDIKEQIKGIKLNTANIKSIKDEAPQCYKDIDDIIESVERAGLVKKVCRLKPLGVIKG